MKYLFTFLLATTAFTSRAQVFFGTSFELDDTSYQYHFYIDTLNDTNNIWQIGDPQKTLFTSGISSTLRALVTDTVNTYPANDSSSFIMKLPAWYHLGNVLWAELRWVQFRYQLDIDSGDYGALEISRDNGQSWISHLDDSTLDPLNQPINHFDAPAIGWHNCELISDAYATGPPNLTDSVFFRFTFVSDSIPSNKEGWMIDHFHLQYLTLGVNDVYNNTALILYPNPSSGHLKLISKTGVSKGSVQVTDLNGRIVYQTDDIPESGDLQLPLPDGIYILRYSDSKTTSTQKLIIKH